MSNIAAMYIVVVVVMAVVMVVAVAAAMMVGADQTLGRATPVIEEGGIERA
jgi:ABC-type cobalt transport system substrate-binding protein